MFLTYPHHTPTVCDKTKLILHIFVIELICSFSLVMFSGEVFLILRVNVCLYYHGLIKLLMGPGAKMSCWTPINLPMLE